jgi:hypothetical protein
LRDNQEVFEVSATALATPRLGETQILSSKDEDALRRFQDDYRGTVLAEFLGALSQWRPRTSSYEEDYQVALYRRVLRDHRNLRIEREKKLATGPGGERMVPDFQLADSVLVEMKRDVSASSFDRCVTQLAKYSGAWGDRGTVVLLVCHADAELVKQRLAQRLATMRFERPFITFVLEP